MSLSLFPTTAILALLVLLASIFTTTAQGTVDTTITLSFFTGNHDPVPGANSAQASQNSCVAIPVLTNGFESSLDQAVFAVYQDTECQSYLYSVNGLLANLHGAKSVIWTEVDTSGAHPPGETYTNPMLSHGKTEEERKAKVAKIALLSTGGALIIIFLGIYLWYIDNKKNKARGGVVPDPYSPTTGRSMAEASSSFNGNGKGKGALLGLHRKNESTASSISYLPPYDDEEAYIKSNENNNNNNKESSRPSEHRLRQHPASSNTHHEGGMTKSGSFSLLSYKVGTGAGLDPEMVPQGRNAGFGLGYDLEEYKRRDTRRDSDVLMREAMMTPPHSPSMRPLSMVSDDGFYHGRHSLSASADSTIVQMPVA
ncbi:hypothetical protein BGZ94_002511 [Podila epigama]|nr:hypothetical protein BGZ94_002511 [Podila epigama]